MNIHNPHHLFHRLCISIPTSQSEFCRNHSVHRDQWLILDRFLLIWLISYWSLWYGSFHGSFHIQYDCSCLFSVCHVFRVLYGSFHIDLFDMAVVLLREMCAKCVTMSPFWHCNCWWKWSDTNVLYQKSHSKETFIHLTRPKHITRKHRN